MDFDEAFGDEVTPREFFLEKLPALHRGRLEQFELFSETTLRFSVRLSDVDEQYSVELRPDGADAREGEFIDFPVVTIEGTSGPWEVVRKRSREAFEKGERALERNPPTDRIDDEFLADLERYDGVFEIEVEFPDLDEPAEFRLILNDYRAPQGAPKIRATVGAEAVRDLFEGHRSPDEVARSADVSGEMSLAFELGGVLMEHFPELER